MSLTYRSPIEEALTSFTSAEQSLIADSAVKHYSDIERAEFKLFNYAIPAYAKEKLLTAGIYLSPFSGIPHSHPVCKTLENYILYKCLPPLLDNTFYFVGIKDAKLNFLKQRHKDLGMINLINRFVTSLDCLRYPNAFVNTQSQCINSAPNTRFTDSSDTLRDLLPNCIKLKARKLFLHDELHYWSIKELRVFLSALKPEVVIGTVVYPPELLVGSKSSLNPWCYTYEIKGNNLIYSPDGVMSESYEQPVNGGYLLKTAKIHLPTGETYCVDLLASKFSHHLIAITRGDRKTKRWANFNNFDATTHTGLVRTSRGLGPCLAIPYPIVNRLYRYLRSLLRPDVQSAMSKLSQLMPEPTAFQIKFTQEFSQLVIKTNPLNSMIDAKCFDAFKNFLLKSFPAWFAKMFSVNKAFALDDFVSSMEAFHFSVELDILRDDHGFSFDFTTDYFQSCEETELLDLMQRFENGNSNASRDRPTHRYEVGKYVFNIPGAHEFCMSIFKALGTSYFASPGLRVLVASEVGEMIAEFCAAHKLLKLLWSPKKTPVYSHTLCEFLNSNLSKCRVRKTFQELGIAFFIGPYRRNQYYIDSQAHNPKVYLCPRVATLYDSLLRELDLSSVNLKVARTTNEPVKVQDGCATKRKTHTVMKEQPTETTIDNSVSVGDARELIASVSGSSEPRIESQIESPFVTWTHGCGLKIPVYVAHGLEGLDLSAPDKLGNRAAGWYTRDGTTSYTYTGGSHHSLGWPMWIDLMLEAHNVNPELYDSFLYQEYDSNGRIGFHADDEEIFLLGGSVHTFSWDGSCYFSFSCSSSITAHEINGPVHFQMPLGFQIDHKHSVSQCSRGRKSMTFRKLSTPSGQGTDEKESAGSDGNSSIGNSMDDAQKFEDADPLNFTMHGSDVTVTKFDVNGLKGIEKQVPGDGDCFYHCVGLKLAMQGHELRALMREKFRRSGVQDPNLERQLQPCIYTELEGISFCAAMTGLNIDVYNVDSGDLFSFKANGLGSGISIKLSSEHFTYLEPYNNCYLKAIASHLGRSEFEVELAIYGAGLHSIQKSIIDDQGLDYEQLEVCFDLFSIQAFCTTPEGPLVLNPSGKIKGFYRLSRDHVEFDPKAAKDYKSKHLAVGHSRVGQSLGLTTTLATLGTKVNAELRFEFAKTLEQSLRLGTTGVISSELFSTFPGFKFTKEDESVEVKLTVIVGTFGCGKSTALVKILSHLSDSPLLIISPRRKLCENLESNLCKALGPAKGKTVEKLRQLDPNWAIMTFERALMHVGNLGVGTTIILDESQLYPPGYIDLLHYLGQDNQHLILLGDPCQSDYDNELDRATFADKEADICRILNGVTYKYAVLSKRFSNPELEGRLPCKIELNAGGFEVAPFVLHGLESLISEAEPVIMLVSSFVEKKAASAYLPHGSEVYTFGESTGMTIETGYILISAASQACSEKRWITALSRFRFGPIFVSSMECSESNIILSFRDRALGRFLTKTASLDDLLGLLPGTPEFVDNLMPRVGKNEGLAEEKLRGDPWLKAELFLGQVEDEQVLEDVIELVQEPYFKTHIPRCDMEGVRAHWAHKILAKEHRELRIGYLVSNQFADDHHKGQGASLTNAAERFEAIYPKHRASDTVTFIMAARKRLRFSNPRVECRKLNEAKTYGQFMLKEFLKRVPIKKSHNKGFMDRAKAAFEEKKLAKSSAVIENHSNRSCRDWLADTGLVFLKSQHCTKFDNRFRDAKAGQSIVCFQHSVLCRLAPYMRYIEMKVNEVLPENFYIHSGKGLDELSTWVRKYSFEGVCTESDYEAFDASQDQYIMAFELALMKYLLLPEDLINDYIFIKTHLGSKIGNFAIMRFSGEASTFLFNTLANMLFTFLKYDLKGNEAICFAGDDMCANSHLRSSDEHSSFLKKLKLKAKVQYVSKPTFCGWNLCSDGIYKKPQLVFERLCIAKETGNLKNCIDNYAIEVSYAYRLGERALQRMDEEETRSYFNCVRVIIKNKHHMKSNVRDLFTALE
ncbi:replicase [Butterbur mosaic virus]|uniref:Replicase n=1 Tax=Butterbur mosaic virus TaxID=666859 RepID=D2Z042_9VIRU|nr:replicase [Butterbur mosaic virus]BAI49692.1 replicase [Butterbur mosaic virus]